MASLRPTNAVLQLGWYLIVGGSAFVIDIGCFVALTKIGVPVLLASALSFLMATVVNYFLCYKLAFLRGRFGRANEIVRLFGVALIGLGLNTLFVWLFIAYMRMLPVVAKVSAVPFVFGWKFLGRRLFVFHPEVPEATFTITQFIETRGRRCEEPTITKSHGDEPSGFGVID